MRVGHFGLACDHSSHPLYTQICYIVRMLLGFTIKTLPLHCLKKTMRQRKTSYHEFVSEIVQNSRFIHYCFASLFDTIIFRKR